MVNGWTFREIDDLTFFDVADLLDYWTRYTPTHLVLDDLRRLLVKWMGGTIEPRDEPKAPPREATKEEVNGLLAQFGAF